MKSFKKGLSIALILTMLITLMSACETASKDKQSKGKEQQGNSDTTVSSSEETDAAPKPVTLTLMKMYSWYSNPDGWKWGDDPVTKKITEETGVTIDIISPAGDGNEKATMMLMSGDYPDIMWMDRNATLQKYIDADALYSIDELTSKYNCPDIMGNYIPQNVIDYLKRPDGKLYLIPNWYNEHGELGVGSSIMYREDIYKELGSPELNTLDDYTNFLRKVKESNITFDGTVVSPIALSGSFGQVMTMGNFWGESIANNMYFDEATNSVQFAMRAKGAYESAKWWNTLYREGLADPENLTLESEQVTEAYCKGKYAAFIGNFWDTNDFYEPSLELINPDAHYISVKPLPAVSGVEAKFDGYSQVGWNANVITKNCKDPEAAIRLYDYLLSPEGQRLTFSGVEGISAEPVNSDGVALLKPEIYEAARADWGATTAKYGFRLLDLCQYQKYNYEYAIETGRRKDNRATVESTNWDATPLMIMQLEAESSEGKKWANIQGTLNTTGLTKALTAKTEADFDKEYYKFLSDLDNMGLKDVEQAWTKLYLDLMSNAAK